MRQLYKEECPKSVTLKGTVNLTALARACKHSEFINRQCEFVKCNYGLIGVRGLSLHVSATTGHHQKTQPTLQRKYFTYAII
jgi:hypothetical protein